MNIQLITEGKKDYMDMLLLADPQEDMIEKYLGKGEMFILILYKKIEKISRGPDSLCRRTAKKQEMRAEKYRDQGRRPGKRLWKVYDPFYLRTLQQPMRYHVCRYRELRKVYWIL